MLCYSPWSYAGMLENKVKIEPFVNNCLELWLFYHIIYSTLSSYRYEYVSRVSFLTPKWRVYLLLLLLIGCQSAEVMLPHPHLLYWLIETDEIILPSY